MWRTCFLVLAFSFLVMSEEAIEYLNLYLNAFIDKKCSENCDATALAHITEARDEYKNCITSHRWRRDLEGMRGFIYQFCEINPPTQYRCLETFLKRIEPHLDLDPEEKYFRDFSLYSFNSSIAELCKDNGDFLQAQLIKIGRAGECYLPYNNLEHNLRECIFMSNVPKNSNHRYFVVRNYTLCKDLKAAEGCMVDFFYKGCQDDTFSAIIRSCFQGPLNWCSQHDASIVFSIQYKYHGSLTPAGVLRVVSVAHGSVAVSVTHDMLLLISAIAFNFYIILFYW